MDGLIKIPNQLETLLKALPSHARPFLVGGCVRDGLLGLPIKDYDLEIFGLPFEELMKILKERGRTDTVGKCFGIIKWTPQKGQTFDIALPRRETKSGKGHRGFDVVADPNLTTTDAAARRDFTINAIMYDPMHHEMLDPFDGKNDLENKVLRHTSPAFSEDPLRVLRGMQFAGRFGLTGHPDTIRLCQSIKQKFHELASERIWEEWHKWASLSRQPSMGLAFLDAAGWMEHFPELHAMKGIPQDPVWHPEGDVWQHTCHCCDALVHLPAWKTAKNEQDRLVWMLAILLHDTGKTSTTSQVEKEGTMRIVSPGHDKVSATLAEEFLIRMKAPNIIRERIIPLVAQHMIHVNTVTDRAVRRLAKRLEPETIPSLCTVMSADAMGRPPLSFEIPAHILEIQRRAEELNVLSNAPEPFLKGRDLIAMGIEPGKQMGEWLRQSYELQLEGDLENHQAALDWIQLQTKRPPEMGGPCAKN